MNVNESKNDGNNTDLIPDRYFEGENSSSVCACYITLQQASIPEQVTVIGCKELSTFYQCLFLTVKALLIKYNEVIL